MKINRYIRLAILFSPILLLIFACSGREIESHLLRAEELKGTRKFDEALQVYKLITKSYPNDDETALAYMRMGDLHFYTFSDDDRALSAYGAVIQKWPFSEHALEAAQKRAEIFETEGDFSKSISEYEWILKHFPDDAHKWQIRLQIAEDYLSLNDPYQASVELENLVNSGLIETESRTLYGARGRWWGCFNGKCPFELGAQNSIWQKVLAKVEKPIIPDDVFSKALLNLGESYLFLEDFNKAYGVFKTLEEMFPEAPFLLEVRLRMVECLESLEHMDLAIDLQKKLMRLYPDSEIVKKRAEALTRREKKRNKPELEVDEKKDKPKG